MEFEGPVFILAIIAFSTLAWLINNWIRAKHGYALEDEWGGKTERSANPADSVETCLLYTSPSPRDATLSRMPSSA